MPVECGEPADKDSHSIQEHGPLSDIASVRKGGSYVLQFFPDVQSFTQLTRGAEPRLGTRWLWDVESVPPREVPISMASVRHFACCLHDRCLLGKADNLTVPELGGRITFDDRNPPPMMAPFLESLFFLSYRTLLFHISQFRGAEKAALDALTGQVNERNRFGVQMCLKNLDDLSPTLTELFRLKSGFDRRILGESSAIRLTYHVKSFSPIIRYASSEYIRLDFHYGCDTIPVWASRNILPLNGCAWLIVSHPCDDRSQITSMLANKVRDLATTTGHLRRKYDFELFSDSTNLFACPDEFAGLSDSERSEVGVTMARNVCESPLKQGLELLRGSSVGDALISDIEKRLAT